MDIRELNPELIDPFHHLHQSASRMRGENSKSSSVGTDRDSFGFCPIRRHNALWERLFQDALDQGMSHGLRADFLWTAHRDNFSFIDNRNPIAKLFRFLDDRQKRLWEKYRQKP
jgi:hypothetical protein